VGNSHFRRCASFGVAGSMKMFASLLFVFGVVLMLHGFWRISLTAFEIAAGAANVATAFLIACETKKRSDCSTL
jgi:small neutral amino acid transporter SnatA (MarC family)